MCVCVRDEHGILGIQAYLQQKVEPKTKEIMTVFNYQVFRSIPWTFGQNYSRGSLSQGPGSDGYFWKPAYISQRAFIPLSCEYLTWSPEDDVNRGKTSQKRETGFWFETKTHF